MPAPRSPSAALLQVCLAGLATSLAASLAPSSAAADPLDFLRRSGPEDFRCTPTPPEHGVNIGALSVQPLETPVASLAVGYSEQAWLVGADGRVWQHQRGAAWEDTPPAQEGTLRAIASIGGLTWAVGDGGVIRQQGTDGQWSTVSGPRADLHHVDMASPLVAAVATEDGGLFLTDDGGQDWQRMGARRGEAVTTLELSHDALMAGRTDGSVVLATRAEEGWTDRTVAVSKQPIRDVHITNSRWLMAVDEDGDIWRSTDSGETWLEQTPAGAGAPIREIIGGVQGVKVVRADGAIARLLEHTDHLATEPLGSDLPAPPPGIDVADAVGTGQGVLVRTTDGRLLHQPIEEWFTGGHPCGRPFEVDRQAILAAPAQGMGWGEVLPAAALPESARTALAAAWLQDARAEHASVASFARFSLRLMALGAPAALVSDAQQAMGDEIRHAERCFALASRYAGTPLRPGPLPMAGALTGGGDLCAVSVEVLREGAIGESIGALLADTMRQQATDPHVRAALDGIAVDEARHAQMAWRFLGWAVAEGGEPVRAALRAALEDAITEHLDAAAALEEQPEVAGWQAHGRLRVAEQRRVVRRAIRRVVRPCAQALLR